jgi:hypothetical protein
VSKWSSSNEEEEVVVVAGVDGGREAVSESCVAWSGSIGTLVASLKRDIKWFLIRSSLGRCLEVLMGGREDQLVTLQLHISVSSAEKPSTGISTPISAGTNHDTLFPDSHWFAPRVHRSLTLYL